MKPPVKVLSIRQPWAWAIVGAGGRVGAGKTIENRAWTTRYRGTLLIHASITCSLVDCAEAMNWMFGAGLINEDSSWPGLDDAPRGGIVGKAKLVDVIRPELGEREAERIATLRGADLRWWERSRNGLVLTDVKPLPFILWPGSLGLLDAPPALLAQVRVAHVGP